MQESDAESSDEDDDDDGTKTLGFGESLIKDEEDEKYLNSLPELERENVFNERYEKRTEWLKNKELRKEMRYWQLLIPVAALIDITYDGAYLALVNSKERKQRKQPNPSDQKEPPLGPKRRQQMTRPPKHILMMKSNRVKLKPHWSQQKDQLEAR